MQHLAERQKDPQYLKNVIAQRQIMIQQLQRQNKQYQKQIQAESDRNNSLESQLKSVDESLRKQILNLKMAIEQLTRSEDALKQDKNQLEFNLNLANMKNQQSTKQFEREVQFLKNQFETQKDSYQNRIGKLEANLNNLHNFYGTDQKLKDDRHQIIEDSNRDMRGFSNQQQSRLIILQNQQYANEIQFQSKNITSLLEKNQKLQDQIKYYKRQLQIHKGIEHDLVKRSSLAQSLIKHLNKRISQLQAQQLTTRNDLPSHYSTHTNQSRVSLNDARQLKDQINKLKFQLAKQNNYVRYIQNKSEHDLQKYQTLANILANYLENLYFYNHIQPHQNLEGANLELSLDIPTLKSKDIKEWSSQQMQAVVSLLLIQIKPYLSKKSLVSFPEIKNLNISFVQETSKEPISLPKISQDYEKAYDKQVKKNAKFKDIPIDISTKILRSNLREWGKKVTYGNSNGNRKYKSRSTVHEIQKIDRSIL